MNGPERASHYHTLALYDADGRIIKTVSGPRPQQPKWKDEANVLELDGLNRVHPSTHFVAMGAAHTKEKIYLRADEPSVHAGNDHHVVRAWTKEGSEVLGVPVVVDGQHRATTPVTIEWVNPARVKVAADAIMYNADPIRILFVEAPDAG